MMIINLRYTLFSRQKLIALSLFIMLPIPLEKSFIFVGLDPFDENSAILCIALVSIDGIAARTH
jgi:hypothetical protein